MANATVRLYANKFACTQSTSPSTVVDVTEEEYIRAGRAQSGVYSYCHIGFNGSPLANIGKKRLVSMKLMICWRWSSTQLTGVMLQVTKTFNPETLVWSNGLERVGTSYYIDSATTDSSIRDREIGMGGSSITDEKRSEYTHDFVSNLAIRAYPSSAPTDANRVTEASIYKTLLASGAPYAEITYDDSINVASKVTVLSGPTSGYVNPRESASLSWKYEKDDDYYCIDDTFTQASAVFHWKYSTDENYNDIAISGSQTNLTIPANTFDPLKTVQWYIEGTDDGGTTSQTSVYSFTTAASSVKATAVSPSSTIKSSNQPITFRWTYSSSDGFAPTRYKFMWKLSTAADWTTILDDTNVVTQYTFPANTFPAGEIRWGVVPYNIDGVQGTGQSASFICYGAPEAPVVYADSKPYTTVTWQASDQQAYQIKVDDTVYGPYFGTEKSFELPDCLEDGEHVIGVAVIGTYALWSAWGETTVTIQNVPGAAISLDAEAQIDVELMINTAEENPTFMIYRDDALIGKTNKRSFTDRLVLGAHKYRVISKLANGNYSISNEITRTACARDISIALLAGGEWLEIKLSAGNQMDPVYNDAITSAYHHISGSAFPTAVVSQYRDLSVSFSALFPRCQRDKQKKLMELLGKTVIIKFRDGSVIVGVMDSWQKEPNRWHYETYTFTVKHIDFEDFVDDTE